MTDRDRIKTYLRGFDDIALEMHPTSDLFVQRRVRVLKMRSTKHETGYFALSYEDGAFEGTRSVTGSS